MKAQDMVQAVYNAELELAAEVAGIVNKKLAALSEATGLILGEVTINTIEATTSSDQQRKWVVKHARIENRLPHTISTEG